jgi:hypothetical protein
MATEIEVDIAVEAFSHVPGGGREAMIAALEAAERVRPRKISTERTRRHRAKKRAGNVPPNGNVPANVPSNAPWNVARPQQRHVELAFEPRSNNRSAN